MPIRVLLADSQPIYVDGLSACLSRQADFEVVGRADNGGEALALVKKWAPDILIVDIDLPFPKGSAAEVELVARLCAAMPAGKVLILAADDDEGRAPRCFEAGAKAFLLKSVRCGDLVEAIRGVRKGWAMVSAQMPRFSSSGPRAGKREAESADTLSARELGVLKLVALGMSSRRVGRRLRLSARTVETHRGRIMRKLGVHNTAALVRRAGELGLLRGA